jgi:hypothetical protein
MKGDIGGHVSGFQSTLPGPGNPSPVAREDLYQSRTITYAKMV